MTWKSKTAIKASPQRILITLVTLLLLGSLLLGSASPAHAEKYKDRWKPLSPEEFETYRPIFSPYDIATHPNDIAILSWSSLRIFRIENSDYCTGNLCLTIVISACGRSSCPSTTLFATRDVEFDRSIAGFFGGTQFLVFRLSQDRDIVVMLTKRFISVWRGFGEQ